MNPRQSGFVVMQSSHAAMAAMPVEKQRDLDVGLMACDLRCTTQHELANLFLWHANDRPCSQAIMCIALPSIMSW